MENNPITDAALAELDRLHETAIPLTFANAAGHIFNAYPALRQRLLDAEARLADAERERDAMKEHCAMLKRQIRWFLSGAAPCDRGKIWPRSDVDELEASLSVTPDQDLTDRDAKQRREGAAEELTELANNRFGDGLFLPERTHYTAAEVREILEQAAKRLREGK